jgi:chromosome segregation ATPase
MTDNSHALKRARRQDSQAKRRKAAEILQAMIDAGEPVTFPAVARRAGVSVSLLYADSELAGRLSKARSRQRDAGTDRAWRLPARSLVSEQSLHADLANAKDHIRRLNQELALLRDRLARQLGAEADTATGRALSPLLEQLEQRAADLEAGNARLRERIAELQDALRESGETLEAARAMNRELMAEINRSVQPESRPAAATSRAASTRRRPPRNRQPQSGV